MLIILRITAPGLAMLMVILFSSCASSEYGSATKKDKATMLVKEEKGLLAINKLKVQEAPSFASRGNSRGLDNLAGALISLATNAIVTVIVNDKKKYTAEYPLGLTDLYFYDQLSNESAFDPAGLQFGGFRLVRTFERNTGERDTALYVEFELDTTNISEIISNSTFRLKLKSFQLKYAKAKIAKNDPKMLNMDFEITFSSSYVNEQGVLFTEQELGKFYLFIRDAPLDSTVSGYAKYYKNQEGKLLMGKSFIVPRSFGYHRESSGEIKSGYSQGLYSIKVNVKESSRTNFVTRMVMENAPLLLTAGSKDVKVNIDKPKTTKH